MEEFKRKPRELMTMEELRVENEELERRKEELEAHLIALNGLYQMEVQEKQRLLAGLCDVHSDAVSLNRILQAQGCSNADLIERTHEALINNCCCPTNAEIQAWYKKAD